MGQDLTHGGVIKTILKTAVPMIIAFSLQSAFNIVDAYFVGKISADALAAVSASFPIVFLIISLGTGLGVGSSSLIARSIGAKDIKKAGEVAVTAFCLAVLLSVFITIIGLLSAGYLFDLMGVTEEVKVLGVEYIWVILSWCFIFFMAFVGNSIIRGEGEMMIPMVVMSFSSILNIFLDPLFIFYFDMGVRGAAIATVISRSDGLFLIILYFISGRSWMKLNSIKTSFSLDHVKGIFSVGLPSSISNLFMSLGIFLLTIIVAGFGTEALAAFGVGFRLDSLAILPGIGISVAVISLVGQNVGAGKHERAWEMTFKAGLLACFIMTFLGMFYIFFAESIVSLFNDDPIVVGYGSSFLKIVPITYLVVGLSMAVSSAFLGAGKPIPSLFLTFLRVILLNIPLAYVISLSYGVEGIWMGILLSSYLTSIIALLFFRKSYWIRKVSG